jgi:ligand-binding sensor domain-containing protein/signal transduction histidine kinase
MSFLRGRESSVSGRCMRVFREKNGHGCLLRLFRLWTPWALLLLFVAPSILAESRIPAGKKIDPAMQYTRRIWRIQDGLPEDTVQAIQQSQDGFLWIGTTGGLLRFDGSHFLLYNHANVPALADNSVFCILAARDGSVWFGTEGGGLLQLKNGSFRAYGQAAGLTNGFVRSLLEDDQGRIWIGTDNGLFQFVHDRLRRIDTSAYASGLAVHAIIEDREHRIWVGGSALLVYDGNSVSVKRLPGRDSENRVKSILETQDGAIWVGTVGGLNRLDNAVFRTVAQIKGSARTLRQTSDGILWIGTIGHGLYRYAEGRFSRWTSADLLPSSTVLSLFADSQQQVWIGTQDGMMRLGKTPVSVIALPNQPDGDNGTIFADRDGTVWAASSVVFSIRNGMAQPHRFPHIPDVAIRNVFRDAAGDLWLGTDGTGIYRLTHSGVIHYTAPAMLVNNFIRAFTQSRDGAVWVATDEGVTRIAGNQTRNYREHDGLAYFSTRVLIEDRDGDIWIGTDRGLSHLHNGAFLHDAATTALAQEKVWTILEDHTGALWFGTRSDGLFRYAHGNISRYTTAQGLANNNICQILEDRRGSLWLSGPTTISSFALPSGPDSRLKVNVYELPYDAGSVQMWGGEQPSGSVAPNGDIWFASSRGAVRVLPVQPVLVTRPQPLLTGVTADGRAWSTSSNLVFPASLSRLEIAFAPLLLRPQDGVRFRYRLEGFDQDWVDAGAGRTASYTNLPAGNFRFRVASFELSDPASFSEISFNLEKRPHFYDMWWFRALCLLAAALLTWTIYQSRIRLWRLRFKLVLEERSRLAREMHDTVIQGCTSISALLEAISSLQRGNVALQENLLDHARMQVRATIDEARDAVWNLRHNEDSVEDLGRSATAIAVHTSEEFGIAVDCKEKGRPFRMRGALARELLMVIREAVYNGALHGKPRRIDIKLVYSRDALESSITDDGCGFDVVARKADGSQHYGIEGMRERVERMGGRIGIVSAPQQGTTVSFNIRRSHLQSPPNKGSI